MNQTAISPPTESINLEVTSRRLQRQNDGLTRLVVGDADDISGQGNPRDHQSVRWEEQSPCCDQGER